MSTQRSPRRRSATWRTILHVQAATAGRDWYASVPGRSGRVSMCDVREVLRNQLMQSYLHRPAEGGAKCALCGEGGRPLAFHMLECSIAEGSQFPPGFVPMSASRGRVRGCYPICNRCAPACSRCRLSVPTEPVLELGHKKGASTGNGVCQHIQWGSFFSALVKRLFKQGRFSGRQS